jgi:hypothetical protein
MLLLHLVFAAKLFYLKQAFETLMGGVTMDDQKIII